LKHVILTGKQSSISGLHSYNDLIQRGAKLPHQKLNEPQASVNPDSSVAIYYTSGTTGQSKAVTVTNFGIFTLFHAQWELFGPVFTRICAPIPMFHICSEIVGVLNIAVAKCKIIFPPILSDAVSTMKTIHEEKCTLLIGTPIIFRDILKHPDKKIGFKFITFLYY